MRLLLFLSLFLLACQSPTSPTKDQAELATEEVIPSYEVEKYDTIEKELLNSMLSEQKIQFTIPKEFITNTDQTAIDTLLSDNYFFIENTLEAKYYYPKEGNVLLAINNFYTEGSCSKYKAYLLKFVENDSAINIFNDFYPDISLYSFYGFGDKQVAQLEGDEKTIYAGYKLDLNKDNKLGVQFMFCNENSVEDTKQLNENGKVIYKEF